MKGTLTEINGPVVKARVAGINMADQVYIGAERLLGEVIWIQGDTAIIQVYEDTSGLKVGETVESAGEPISVELAPGLLKGIFDGIQRPLDRMSSTGDFYIKRGAVLEKLDRNRKWHFVPKVSLGDELTGGQIFGEVVETEMIVHKLMVPPNLKGKVIHIASEGEYSITEKILVLSEGGENFELSMLQKWPVRRRRPAQQRYLNRLPLITGQRIIDFLFPIIKGGVSAIPGGFGTGKTMLQHQLAKWSDADIIIYVGCGERGNEMTQVLREFPELVDPRSGKPLIERTVLIANTSNMPVTAREASIYTGITIAEYFRDMGYNVAMMADSTSRWAEALREISGRLEELPAEEGYPSYLPTRLAEFYERAGAVTTLGGQKGSITIIGAVSPPGGDFSEPVTQNTKRFIRCFWALDRELASARHFPAISWIDSYSDYGDIVQDWWNENVGERYGSIRREMLSLLQEAQNLSQIAQIVGAEALPDDQRLILFVGDLIKNGLLQQNAYDEVDTYCSPEKQYKMACFIMDFYKKIKYFVLAGAPIIRFFELKTVNNILRMKYSIKNEQLDKFDELYAQMNEDFEEFEAVYGTDYMGVEL